MNCKDAYSLIQDLIDGRLSPGDARSLERHTAACPVCTAELRSYRTLTALISELTLEAPPKGLADRVIGLLRVAGRIAEPSATGRFPWLRTRFRVALAGVTLCAIALALFPATIRPLTGLAGKGAVVATGAYVVLQDKLAEASVLRGVLDNLEKNLKTLKTVGQAGFSLIATAGEIFMLPALAFLFMLTGGIAWYARAIHKGSAGHASYSF